MLRKGLTSELFFLAFLQPETGYKLAQNLQRMQSSKKIPNTSKTHPALKKLEEAGYLRREDDGKFHYVPEKLVQELIDYLKKEQDTVIDAKEKKFLNYLMSENYFFFHASHEVIHRMIGRPKRTHDLDSIKTISDKIGQICAMQLEIKKKYRSNKPKTNQSFEKIQKDLSKFVEVENKKMEALFKLKQIKQIEKKIGRETTLKEKMIGIDMLNKTLKSKILIEALFDKIPNTTIEKFAYLWSQYYGFQIGINTQNMA